MMEESGYYESVFAPWFPEDELYDDDDDTEVDAEDHYFEVYIVIGPPQPFPLDPGQLAVAVYGPTCAGCLGTPVFTAALPGARMPTIDITPLKEHFWDVQLPATLLDGKVYAHTRPPPVLFTEEFLKEVLSITTNPDLVGWLTQTSEYERELVAELRRMDRVLLAVESELISSLASTAVVRLLSLVPDRALVMFSVTARRLISRVREGTYRTTVRRIRWPRDVRGCTVGELPDRTGPPGFERDLSQRLSPHFSEVKFRPPADASLALHGFPATSPDCTLRQPSPLSTLTAVVPGPAATIRQAEVTAGGFSRAVNTLLKIVAIYAKHLNRSVAQLAAIISEDRIREQGGRPAERAAELWPADIAFTLLGRLGVTPDRANHWAPVVVVAPKGLLRDGESAGNLDELARYAGMSIVQVAPSAAGPFGNMVGAAVLAALAAHDGAIGVPLEIGVLAPPDSLEFDTAVWPSVYFRALPDELDIERVVEASAKPSVWVRAAIPLRDSGAHVVLGAANSVAVGSFGAGVDPDDPPMQLDGDEVVNSLVRSMLTTRDIRLAIACGERTRGVPIDFPPLDTPEQVIENALTAALIRLRTLLWGGARTHVSIGSTAAYNTAVRNAVIARVASHGLNVPSPQLVRIQVMAAVAVLASFETSVSIPVCAWAGALAYRLERLDLRAERLGAVGELNQLTAMLASVVVATARPWRSARGMLRHINAAAAGAGAVELSRIVGQYFAVLSATCPQTFRVRAGSVYDTRATWPPSAFDSLFEDGPSAAGFTASYLHEISVLLGELESFR